MGYLHIENLYKNQDIFLFKECYALEKIHGTSAHVRWKHGRVGFFSGGVSHKHFLELFSATLADRFKELGLDEVVVYGEAYGGKCQGMRRVYGENLQFIVFDVKVGDVWLSVPQAEEVAKSLGLSFVFWEKIPATLEAIDAERDNDSAHAVEPGHKREGIVLRPLIELRKNNNTRIIAKHKNDDYRETTRRRKVTDPAKLQAIANADAIADEWVTPMRLSHVLDKIPEASIEKMGEIIKAMFEDIQREAEGEIVWSKQAQKAIGRRTALMIKQLFREKLRCVER